MTNPFRATPQPPPLPPPPPPAQEHWQRGVGGAGRRTPPPSPTTPRRWRPRRRRRPHRPPLKASTSPKGDSSHLPRVPKPTSQVQGEGCRAPPPRRSDSCGLRAGPPAKRPCGHQRGRSPAAPPWAVAASRRRPPTTPAESGGRACPTRPRRRRREARHEDARRGWAWARPKGRPLMPRGRGADTQETTGCNAGMARQESTG